MKPALSLLFCIVLTACDSSTESSPDLASFDDRPTDDLAPHTDDLAELPRDLAARSDLLRMDIALRDSAIFVDSGMPSDAALAADMLASPDAAQPVTGSWRW